MSRRTRRRGARASALWLGALAVGGALGVASVAVFWRAVTFESGTIAGHEEMQAELLAEAGAELAARRFASEVETLRSAPRHGVFDIGGSQVAFSVEPIAAPEVRFEKGVIPTRIESHRIDASAAFGEARVIAHRIMRTETRMLEGSSELFAEPEDPPPLDPRLREMRVPGFYRSRAGLVLDFARDGSWNAWNRHRADVSKRLRSVVRVTRTPDLRTTGTTTGEMHALEIDLLALERAGLYPPNGLIYAADPESAAGTGTAAVKLTGATRLAAALTLVTPNAAIAGGDFNTLEPKPAALVADEIILLSGAWGDDSIPGTAAEDSAFEVWLLAGRRDPRHPGAGSMRGLVHLPEDWSGAKAVVRGVFADLRSGECSGGAWEFHGDGSQAPLEDPTLDRDPGDVSAAPPFVFEDVRVVGVVGF